MNRQINKKQTTISAARAVANAALIALFLLFAPLAARMASAQTPARFIGTITSINGDMINVKTDAGQVYQVQVPSAATIERIAPGEKNLSAAVAMKISDLDTGDRALVTLDPNAPAGGTPQAARIVTIKAADVAAKQAQEQRDWQVNGVGGLVKSVDPATGTIMLTTGAGPAMKTITVQTSSSTVLKRYAPASVRYDLAQPAPISAIQVGDQLRARGTKSADGDTVTAAEVVSGSFRNISGLITSIDAGASSLVVKDLLTKKPVTVVITPDSQMRKLDERMATVIAMRLKGAGAGGGRQFGGGAGGGQGAPGGGARAGGAEGGPGGRAGGAGGFDAQRLLSMAQSIKLSDLQKGEAVMVVATEGSSGVTAITLVAGVEPLLEAPAAADLLSNWSLSSGSPDESGGQ